MAVRVAVARLCLRFGSAVIVLGSGCRYGYEYFPSAVDRTGTDQSGAGGTASGVAGSGGAAPDVGGSKGTPLDPVAGASGAPDTGSEAGQSSVGGTGADHPALVGYWPLDATTGTIAADSSGHGNDGALQSFVANSWTTGKRGGALELADGPYVRVEPSASIDSIADTDAVTIAAWVMLAPKVHGFEAVLSLQLGNTNSELFGLYLNASRPVVVINSNGATHECYGAALPANQWRHLAATFDGATARAYVDGLEVCNVVPDIADIATSTNPILIGCNQNGSTPGEFLDGTLDDLVLYNRALDAAELGPLALGMLPP